MAPGGPTLTCAAVAWMAGMAPADALIDVHLKPASRDIPPGHVARWMWQGPGHVELNASTDGSPLDFYVVSGDAEDMRRRQRKQHGPPKDQPDCRGCSEFFLNSSLPVVDSDVTMLIASNQDVVRTVRVEFQESLMGIPSCMDRCFIRPWGFVGMALILTLFIAFCFRLARPLCRLDAAASDEAWAPQLVQCRRPPKPREAWSSWILHGCIMTYPWNPWGNDPLEYALRCLVLMVSLGLTMFISTLYSHFFNYWDSSISTGLWESVAEDNEPEMSGDSMQGALLISILSLAAESLLRMLALALFRTSLACSRLQKRWHAQAPALVLAATVVMFCIAYPLGLAASAHLCGYIRHLSAQFLMSQVIRGVPLAVAVTSVQYLLLKALGAPAGLPALSAMGLSGELAELNS